MILLFACVISISVPPGLSQADPPGSGSGGSPISGSTDPGGFGAGGLENSNSHGGSTGPNNPTPTVETIDCGPVVVEGSFIAMPTAVCGLVHPMCDAATPAALPGNGAHNFVDLITYPNGTQTQVPHCAVPPGNARPQVTGDMAKAQAEKLLPHPAIGTAPAGGVSLVNIETVLWVDTKPDITLGTVNLLGFRVTLRAHLERADWDFGDGATASSEGPGKAYSHADPCKTAQCPNYFGHTFRRTGEVTIGAQLTWSGQFQVDGGAWQDIPGTVTAPATEHPLHVKEARGVLVDNP